jgi:hypothetical protein
LRRPAPILLAALLALTACSEVRRARRAAIKAVYDPTSGRLVRLAHDSNINGKPDTWTAMNGATPISSTIDRNEDGRIDRWEYYDASGQLRKVGFSRRDDGTPDAWAYSRADGTLERIDISSAADESKIDRREYYTFARPDAPPVLARAEEDANGDGRIDKWEEYDEGGQLRTAAWASAGRSTPDRRVTWRNAAIVLIESNPDASGALTSRLEPR